MRLLAVLLLAVVPVGCGSTSDASKPAGGAGTERTSQPGSDTAAIYASVIRQLVTKDNTFGGAEPPFEVVYVLDGPVPHAADPERPPTDSGQEPFDEFLKQEVERRLVDLPPVRFVAAREEIVVEEMGGASPGRVKGDGVLISLGPVERRDGKVEVATSLWMNGLAGQWLTYVLVREGGDWRVTGTTGPMAIS